MTAPILDVLKVALGERYRIERELGQGGMATVYLAEDVRHRRKVALKVLHPELSAVLGPERFLKEIELTASLQHPHILPLFDSGQADGQLYYVMPFVEGETLRARLEREKQLSIEDALRITREVADALQYAHARGVIHRDIKPENILLQDGHALVADFGIALAVQQAGGQRMTQTGLSLGTPQYMAPEQAMGDRNIDARADVYALGAVAYEMLAGEPPFTSPTAQAIVARVLTVAPAPITQTRPTVPAHVEHAILGALAKLPADRPASAKALSDALGQPLFATSAALDHRPATAASSSGNISRTLFGVTAAVAALGVLATIWLATRSAVSQPRAVLRATLDLPDSVDLIPSGFGSRIAMARDGSKLVFAGRQAGSPGDARLNIDPRGSLDRATPPARRLYVRRRDQLTATALPGTELATTPFFSPDGDRVGFLNRSPVTVKVVGFDGAPPVTIGEGAVDNAGMSWGPGGAIYGSGDGRLVRLSVNGGKPTVVSTLDTTADEVGHGSPDALPNGRGVIFVVAHRPSNVNALRDIAVVDLETGKHRILTRGVAARYAPPGYLVFVRADGTLAAAPFDQDKLALTGPAITLATDVAVSAFGGVDIALGADGSLVYVPGQSVDAAAEVVWVTRDGAANPVDAAWRANIQSVALSPDGARLAVSIAGTSGEEDIWIKELGSGQLSKLTLGGSRVRNPTWLPGGTRIAFVSEDRTPFSLAAKAADGTGSVDVLARESRSVADGVVSHDGIWALYRTSSADSGRGDILATRIGQSTTIPLLATDADERHPALSPDGHWLAYRSTESGTAEVYVRPFPNVADHKWQVSVSGGSDPVWAHSGRELFYLNTAKQMVAVSVTTQPTFAIRDQRVLFALPPDIRSNPTKPFYDVSVDDQRFLMIRAPNSASRSGHTPFVLVENWLEEVRARSHASGGAPR